MHRYAQGLAILVMLCAHHTCTYGACISSGDQSTINNAFASGGAGTVVQLCAGASISITASITCTANNQEISTQGYPTGSTRATIVVTGSLATAIQGQSSACSGFKIRNIQINGNRPALGRLSNGGANIEIGGQASNQVVDYVHTYEPRGWSTMHITEGSCTGAQITNNDIGPSGQPNQEWADGISLACKSSLVEKNTVTDATDGAIVVFGAAGSIIRSNTIIAKTRTLLGGINMVDYAPWNGDYTNTNVSGNTINADSAFIKIGIACGPAAWGTDQTDFNYGGFVTKNTITGNNMGYGIVAAGTHSFTIVDNVSTAKYSGQLGTDCAQPNNAPPMAFLRTSASTGTFQSQFVVGRAVYVICVQPGLSHTYTYQNGQLSLTGNQRIDLDGSYLILQGDGNLVMYKRSDGSVLWASGTCCYDCSTATCQLTFNSNGDVVITRAGTTLATYPPNYTPNLGSSSFRVSDTLPYISVIDGNNNYVWATSYDFYMNFQMNFGQFVRVPSGSSAVFLTLKSDANLVVASGSVGGSVLWTTNVGSGKTCSSGGGCKLVFQGDGNLVIYADQGAVWATGTNPNGYRFHLNAASPYIQIFNSAGTAIYSST